MSGTIAVHQCLFCPQTFGSAVEKDDHILEHFAQETCTDCDQSLIRIGRNLYTLHNAVTCIKRESKLDVSIQHDSHKRSINQNNDDGDYNAIVAPSNTDYGQQLNIKLEPETEHNEQLMSVDPMHFTESINQNTMKSNTIRIDQVEIKTEPGAQVEQFMSVDVNNFTQPNNMDLESGQEFQGQFHLTPLEKLPEPKSKSNFKHKCDFCEKSFRKPYQLEQHKKYTHSIANPGSVIDRWECKICNITFKRKEYLDKHIKFKHTDRIKYTCDFCWAIFMSENSLDNHHRFYCKRSKKSANKSTDNEKLIEVETEVKELVPAAANNFAKIDGNSKHKPKCDVREKSSRNSWQMGEHEEYTHIETDQFECKICNIVFKRKEYLDKHNKFKHTDRIKYTCDFCWAIFMSENSLDNHHRFYCKRSKKSANKSQEKNKFVKMKPGVEELIPVAAEDSTGTGGVKINSSQVLHNQRVTVSMESSNNLACSKLPNKSVDESKGNDTNGSRTCDICKKTLATPASLRTHQFLVHKTGGHHCTRCKQVFRKVQGLQNHGPKCSKLSTITFECYICHKIRSDFKSKTSLRRHIQLIHVHKGKIKCEFCEKYFPYKSVYETHMNVVHLKLNIRNFVCSICGQAFRKMQCLTQHERIHTGERPYICKYEGCSKSFTTHGANYAHMKIHRGLKKFQCRIDGCGEQFGGASGYKKHKLNVHGIPIAK
ncbi:zinc finger protein 62 homolog [Sitodiplosis mosellana]|uniref:zinc finger protein 62 homolog n=1 Tax=Sitodiplosis mosellana TaxID=263140 RepID=UPI00244395DC|nr:zinc finger protein 62 homolog [Sitodiplosis mosellana]